MWLEWIEPLGIGDSIRTFYPTCTVCRRGWEQEKPAKQTLQNMMIAGRDWSDLDTRNGIIVVYFLAHTCEWNFFNETRCFITRLHLKTSALQDSGIKGWFHKGHYWGSITFMEMTSEQIAFVELAWSLPNGYAAWSPSENKNLDKRCNVQHQKISYYSPPWVHEASSHPGRPNGWWMEDSENIDNSFDQCPEEWTDIQARWIKNCTTLTLVLYCTVQ